VVVLADADILGLAVLEALGLLVAGSLVTSSVSAAARCLFSGLFFLADGFGSGDDPLALRAGVAVFFAGVNAVFAAEADTLGLLTLVVSVDCSALTSLTLLARLEVVGVLFSAGMGDSTSLSAPPTADLLRVPTILLLL